MMGQYCSQSSFLYCLFTEEGGDPCTTSDANRTKKKKYIWSVKLAFSILYS